MSNFIPSVWAEQVMEAKRIRDLYNVGTGELDWLLNHWYWPFTEHPYAKYLIRIYGL